MARCSMPQMLDCPYWGCTALTSSGNPRRVIVVLELWSCQYLGCARGHKIVSGSVYWGQYRYREGVASEAEAVLPMSCMAIIENYKESE